MNVIRDIQILYGAAVLFLDEVLSAKRLKKANRKM